MNYIKTEDVYKRQGIIHKNMSIEEQAEEVDKVKRCLLYTSLDSKKMYRITFNEITKTAVRESIKNAREIDMDLVDAQQARRMVIVWWVIGSVRFCGRR